MLRPFIAAILLAVPMSGCLVVRSEKTVDQKSVHACGVETCSPTQVCRTGTDGVNRCE